MLEARLKGWRFIQGRKVRMTELEELRFLAKFSTRPGSSPNNRAVGRWAMEQIKEKYPNRGVIRPKRWELEEEEID